MGYLTDMSMQMGISLWLLIIILIWTLFWKLMALWKSARKNDVIWFIVLALVNTVGILEILYIYVFSKMRKSNNAEKKIVHRKVSKKKKK